MKNTNNYYLLISFFYLITPNLFSTYMDYHLFHFHLLLVHYFLNRL